MKSVFTKLAVMLFMLPTLAFADVKSDMSNPNISLVAVMQNAMADGMSAGDTVKAMIKTDPSMASSIVATGMIVAPGQYAAIISAAIDAGVSADTVVAAALIASDGKNADNVIAAAVRAAPNERDAIVAASVRALPQTASGLTAVAGSPIRATTAQASGGGASVTAADVSLIRSTLAQVETELAAAGFTAAEVATAVNNLTAALTDSQSDVATATSSLAQLQSDLIAAQAAAAALPGLQAQVGQLQTAAIAAESAVDSLGDSATDALASATQAATAADLASAELNDEQAANALIDADDAEFAAANDDDAAFGALVDAKQARTQADIAALGSAAEVEAAAAAAEATLVADAAESALLTVDIQKLEAAIAALEAGGATGVAETVTGGLTTVVDKSINVLRQELRRKNLRQSVVDQQRVDKKLRIAALAKLKTLSRIAGYLESMAAGKGLTNSDRSNLRIASKSSNTKDVTALQTLVNSLSADKAAQQAAAAQRLAVINAEIVKLRTAVRRLSNANEALTKAQAEADLQAIADKVDQVLTSVSQTG